MKCIFIQLLILSILYSGVVLSAGSHDDVFNCLSNEAVTTLDGHEDTHSQHDTKHDSQYSNSFDNCCSNVTCFFNISTDVLSFARSTSTQHDLNRFYSFIVTPPTPPPTA